MNLETLVPKVAIIPLTYKCNAKCVMCNIWKTKNNEEILFDKYKEFFEDPVIKNNLQSVNLTGGEPLLRYDFIEIAEMILITCDKMKSITINTNGFFYEKYEEIVKKLDAMKKNNHDFNFTFYLSIDGLEEIHDKVRGIPGFFNRVMKTIDIFEKLKDIYNFTYSMNFTISTYNYKYMKEVYDFITAKGLNIDFTYSMPSSTYFNNLDDSNVRDYDRESKEYICNLLIELLKDGKLSYSRSYYKNLIKMIEGGTRKIGCIFDSEGLFLHPAGDVFRCWAYDQKMGNIYEESISKIWAKNNTEKDILAIKNNCKNCYNNCYINFKRFDSIKSLIKS